MNVICMAAFYLFGLALGLLVGWIVWGGVYG